MSYEDLYENFTNDFLSKKATRVGTKQVNDIDPNIVINSIDENNVNDNFWGQHGGDIEGYKDLIINYGEAKKEIQIHGNLEHLSLSHPLRTAFQVFHGSQPIKLISYNGQLMLAENGRHRIAAAKILRQLGHEVNISAEVTEYDSVNFSKKLDMENVPNSTPANGFAKEIRQEFVPQFKRSFSDYEGIEGQIALLKETEQALLQYSENFVSSLSFMDSTTKHLEDNLDYKDFVQLDMESCLDNIRLLIKRITDDSLGELLEKIQKKITYLDNPDRIR